MGKIMQYEIHTIKTEIFSRKDIEIHDKEVEKYKNEGWVVIHTVIGYEGSMAIKRTKLERRTPLPKRGLRAECNPIDNTCDIKNEIKELIHRYKYNVSASTVVLYEEFMKDLRKNLPSKDESYDRWSYDESYR
jgi:hypothetical protein